MTAPLATPATPIDTFLERYGPFRLELDDPEMAAFDRMVMKVRRHARALARRPALDFERPILLLMALEASRELDETRAEAKRLQDDLAVVERVLEDAGLVSRRLCMNNPSAVENERQARLPVV